MTSSRANSDTSGAFSERDAMAIGKGLLKTATAGAGLVGAIGDLTANTDVVKNVKEAEEILEWIEVGLTSFEGVVNGALQERDGIAVADSLNAMLGKTLEGLLPEAAALMSRADRVLIVGTSLNVYPAAGLVHYAPASAPMVLVDPKPVQVSRRGLRMISAAATEGVPTVVEEWLAEP